MTDPDVLSSDPNNYAKIDAVIASLEKLGIPRKDIFLTIWVDFQKKSHWTNMYVNGKNYYFGEPEWKKEFARRLLMFRDHIKNELGMDYSNYAIFTIDEPNGNPEMPETTAWYAIEGAKFIRSIDPKIRLWTDPWKMDDGYQHYYLQWYDILLPNLPRLRPLPDVQKAYRESGREIWSYSVLTKETPSRKYRAMFWNNIGYGFTGPATFYDLFRNSGDAYDSTDGGRVTDDYCTIYLNRMTGGFSVSRRMEAWYQGLIDSRLYALARKRVKTVADKKLLDAIVQAANKGNPDYEKLRAKLLEICEKQSDYH